MENSLLCRQKKQIYRNLIQQLICVFFLSEFSTHFSFCSQKKVENVDPMKESFPVYLVKHSFPVDMNYKALCSCYSLAADNVLAIFGATNSKTRLEPRIQLIHSYCHVRTHLWPLQIYIGLCICCRRFCFNCPRRFRDPHFCLISSKPDLQTSNWSRKLQ